MRKKIKVWIELEVVCVDKDQNEIGETIEVDLPFALQSTTINNNFFENREEASKALRNIEVLYGCDGYDHDASLEALENAAKEAKASVEREAKDES